MDHRSRIRRIVCLGLLAGAVVLFSDSVPASKVGKWMEKMGAAEQALMLGKYEAAERSGREAVRLAEQARAPDRLGASLAMLGAVLAHDGPHKLLGVRVATEGLSRWT